MISVIAIVMACLVALITAALGVFALFSSRARLINTVKRSPFGSILPPFPEEGTALWKLLIGFYRLVGVLALSMAIFMIVMLILKLTRGQ